MPKELDMTRPHRMYVAVRMGNGFGQETTVEAARVTGPLESLKGELRQWLLNYLHEDTRETVGTSAVSSKWTRRERTTPTRPSSWRTSFGTGTRSWFPGPSSLPRHDPPPRSTPARVPR